MQPVPPVTSTVAPDSHADNCASGRQSPRWPMPRNRACSSAAPSLTAMSPCGQLPQSLKNCLVKA